MLADSIRDWQKQDRARALVRCIHVFGMLNTKDPSLS